MLKAIFLIIALIVIVLHIGFEQIFHTVSQLGPLPLVVILFPMIVVYGLEVCGWGIREILSSYAGQCEILVFGSLFAKCLRSRHLNFVRLLRNNRGICI